MENLGIDEIWKCIDNYPNYEVSTKGQIRNKKTLKILKPSLRNGYYSVSLCKNNIKTTNNIHRIVITTFVENSNKIVNHKDGNKLNNNLENLEFTTYKNNTLHAINNNITKIHIQPVKQFTLDNILIKEYESIKKASEETGISDKHIGSVCRGNRKTTGGYIWKYSNDFIKLDINKIIGKEIVGFPNYILTKEGNVYSKSRKDYLKKFLNDSGYYKVKLCNNGNYKDFYIHKLLKDNY